MKVQNILATKGSRVITVSPDQTIRQATHTLVEHNIGAVVVLDAADKVVGILSERDIIRAVARDEAIFGQPVSQLMTKNVVVGSPGDDLESVMRTMTERRFRHLPVLEQGRLAGMVSIGDLVKAQLAMLQGEIETLQTQIIQGE